MKTVVVIDDEYAIVETLVDVLELNGYTCVTAANGQQGLEVIEQQHPDLVITDLMMPVMDGRELVAKMRSQQQFETLPIILITAAQEAADTTNEDDAHFMYMRKPFAVSELLANVRRLTEPAGA